jgi:hypothetical protein
VPKLDLLILALDQKFQKRYFWLKNFQSTAKVVHTDFGTRSKVLIMVFLTFKTFDLVKKVASSFLALDWKFKKALLKLSI